MSLATYLINLDQALQPLRKGLKMSQDFDIEDTNQSPAFWDMQLEHEEEMWQQAMETEELAMLTELTENDAQTLIEDDEQVYVVFGQHITAERVAAYLPSNYRVVDSDVTGSLHGDSVIIAGRDNAGWTAADYLAPRLATGGMFLHEPEPELEDWS